MPITVKYLMQSRQELTLVTTQYDDYAQIALEKMRENNFSQLPVIDRDDKLIGIITNNSILIALQTFEIPISQLKVSHATDNKFSACKEDDELSDVFADVKRYESVVIQVKEGQKPAGIITSYDMVDFYSQRAENIILLNNIETALKDHIRLAYSGKEVELREAIDNVHNRTIQTFEQFKRAIKHYKNLAVENKEFFQDEEAIVEVFERHFGNKNKSSTLDYLTFDSFIKVLLDAKNSNYCSFVFNNLEREAIEKLLNAVRNIRNALFHFRREIISDDNKKLRFCSDWLARHPAQILESSENTPDQIIEESVILDQSEIIGNLTIIESAIKQLDEEITQSDSRYLKLAEELNKYSKAGGTERVKFSFKDIEKIIEDKLPKGAREDRSWWSDDDTQPWERVGWNVLNINIIEEFVTFIHRPHRKGYIKFFQDLIEDLSEKAPFRLRFPYQDGRHYITVATIVDNGVPIGNLAYSFTEFHKKFRVEIFIDKNDWAKNKEIYNCLKSHESEIESQLESSLHWEPFDNKPYSRISLHYNNDVLITDGKEELLRLKEWAVDAMIRFEKVINKYVSQCSS